MGNIFKFLLVVSCITLLLCSCESEIENEIQSSTEKLNLSRLELDSLQLGSYELSKMTDELKALKERMDELKKTKTRSVASSNYSQYFSENMWAIRELPFTLSTGGGYLSCTGWGQRVTYEGYNPGSYGKFYVQIPSSITGIPYLIYSNYSKTRLAVGHYTSNPESKILLAMNSNSTTGAMDSWDIIPATNNPGTYVLQNELYIGQGSSGSWWDVFNYVVDIQANNVGFSQYTQRTQQEFTITPDAVFTLKSLEFINPYSATVTQRDNVSIKRAITNSSSQFIRENLVFEKTVQEDSYFKEEKGIAFKVPASDTLFARPTVTLGEIDLVPNASIPTDTKYQPNVRRVLENTLKHIEPVKVSPRTKLTVTYYFKEYDVSVDYVATIEYKEDGKDARIAKLPGRWSGRIHVDEISDVDFEETNLDTQQSVKGKVNIRNASQSSPIIF